jgi:U3 small nucleolar RNA-associated protein 18
MPTLTVYENFPEFHDKKIQIVNGLDFSPNSAFLTLGNNNGKVLLYRLKHFSTY